MFRVLRSFTLDGKYAIQYILNGIFSQMLFDSNIERAEYLAQIKSDLNND